VRLTELVKIGKKGYVKLVLCSYQFSPLTQRMPLASKVVKNSYLALLV
jgi:hypothetical protein